MKAYEQIISRIEDDSTSIYKVFLLKALAEYSENILMKGEPEKHGNSFISDKLVYKIASEIYQDILKTSPSLIRPIEDSI